MHGVEHVGELGQVLEPRPVAGAPPGRALRDVRRRRNAAEGDPVATDVQVPFRSAAVQGELARRGRHQRLDQRRIEPHSGRSGIDRCAGVREQTSRLGEQEVDADLLEHPQRRPVDVLEFVVGHDPQRLTDQTRLSGDGLLGGQVADSWPTAAGTTHRRQCDTRGSIMRRTGLREQNVEDPVVADRSGSGGLERLLPCRASRRTASATRSLVAIRFISRSCAAAPSPDSPPMFAASHCRRTTGARICSWWICRS